jgi:hypothetical protein
MRALAPPVTWIELRRRIDDRAAIVGVISLGIRRPAPGVDFQRASVPLRFSPGPGWEGHIPLGPFYVAWKACEYGVIAKFIELAGEVNIGMPRYVTEKLQAALNERGKTVRGSRILILGLAYT